MLYFARVQASRNKDTAPVCDVVVEASGMVVKDCAISVYGVGSGDGFGGLGLLKAGTRVVVALMGGANMAGPGVVLGIIPGNAVASQMLSVGQATENDPGNAFAPTDGKASPGDTALYKDGPAAILASAQTVRMKAPSIRLQVSGTGGQMVLGTANAEGTVESAIHGEQLVDYLESLQSTLSDCVDLVNKLLVVAQSQQTAFSAPVPPATAAQIVAVMLASLTAPTPMLATLPASSPAAVPDGLTSAILKFERVPEEDV